MAVVSLVLSGEGCTLVFSQNARVAAGYRRRVTIPKTSPSLLRSKASTPLIPSVFEGKIEDRDGPAVIMAAPPKILDSANVFMTAYSTKR